MYGVAEYLMMLQEVETVRLNRQRGRLTRRRNIMDAHRVPNFEEMNEQEAHRFLTELLSNLSPEEEYNVRHQDDYVMEMPQSGERFRGREKMRAFQEAYPTRPPAIQLRRVLVKEGLWVAERSANTAAGRNWTWC